MTTKIMCDGRRCGWHGTSDEVLRAPSPFDEADELWACPWCKQLDELYPACDEPECWQQVTCGTPVTGGYRQTCGKHVPKVAA